MLDLRDALVPDADHEPAEIVPGLSARLLLRLPAPAQAVHRERVAVFVCGPYEPPADQRSFKTLAEKLRAFQDAGCARRHDRGDARILRDGVPEQILRITDPRPAVHAPGSAVDRGRREIRKSVPEPALLAVSIDHHELERHAGLGENLPALHNGGQTLP